MVKVNNNPIENKPVQKRYQDAILNNKFIKKFQSEGSRGVGT